jgi:hypothetical protein
MKKSTLLIAGVLAIILLLVFGKFYFSEQDFNLDNPYWNGLMHVSGNIRPLYAISDLPATAGDGTLLVVEPTRDYTGEEASAISSFVSGGGTLLVLDDYGNSSSLLGALGLPIALRQVPLCQDKDYYKRPSFPIITDIKPSMITRNVTSLTFNHPVPLTVSGNATVIASTTPMGWLDLNDDCIINRDEPVGSFPVMASVKYGDGEVFVIGDPDLFINSMQDTGDNGVLIANVMGPGTVYFDAAHGQVVTPLGRAIYFVKNSLVAQLLCTLGALLLVYLAYRYRGVFKL